MNNYLSYILGITDTLNEWNGKLNSLFDGRSDNAMVATVIVVVVFVVTAWGINTLNKK